MMYTESYVLNAVSCGQKWDNEEDRKIVLAEKHARGEEARAKRRAAKELRGLHSFLELNF